jgi:hypothetical protein
MTRDTAGGRDLVSAGSIMRPGIVDASKAPAAIFRFECVDAEGNVNWTEEAHNVVTTVGKTDILDKYLKGSGYTAAWFLGLAGVGSKVVGDTLASYAGWAELTPYSGNRPAITWGTTSGGANTNSQIAIAITGTATVAGAFTSTVASGTAGTLYNVSDFSVARGVASGDTLNVTVTLQIT